MRLPETARPPAGGLPAFVIGVDLDLAVFVIDVCGGCEAIGLSGGNGADGRRRTEVGGVGVDGAGVVGAEAELLEGAGVGHQLGLPAVVGLVLLHGGFGCGIPLAVGSPVR